MVSPIHYTSNFDDFISFNFKGETNAVCWKRNLSGDFEEIVLQFEFEGKMIEIDEEDLLTLALSKEGQLAREVLLNDLRVLTELGASPVLNIIKGYEKDNELPFFATDVYSFHVDRSPIPVDTILCTYFGAPSEIIPNSQVRQKILIPEIRDELKKLHEGNEDEFESFLSEHFFDLHYQTLPNAQPISLGIGNLCRLATDHPNSSSLPCVHRAPEENGLPRLLLIC
ncbi:MAG: hypothetical protein H6600_05350 [Flavobacteriales bacterium]|nr:hypothetical protein [Flavobacteriales bacterium]